jgi:methyltransferase (TIGR00027 family)
VRADRPSSTAALIAAATVFLARDRALAHLVPPGAAEICARCLSPLALLVSRLPWLARAAERATIPGLCAHFMMRKRWIEQAVRGALGRGASQVVIIGAGYDTLAARLAPEFAHVRFIEVDHPATQAVKRRAVKAAANLSFVPADLARVPLLEALAGSLLPGRSLYIAEGVLMYLMPAQVDRFFAAVGDEAVFTVMEPTPEGRIAFHNATSLERALLRLWGEPFRSALARDELAPFLAKRGFRLRQYADLARAHAELELARGELVVHAERT